VGRRGRRGSGHHRERGLTQERLAWDSELDKGYLSHIEQGHQMPSLPVLATLAARLGVGLTDLVALDADDPRCQLLDAVRSRDLANLQLALSRLGF
jgi:transcriptional regulator with XRE-family HTH domain